MPAPQSDPQPGFARAADGSFAWMRLPLAIDAQELRCEALALPNEAWIPHFNQRDFRGDWTVAPLRAPTGETHPVRLAHADPAAKSWSATSWLTASPCLQRFLERLACPLNSARLMRLGPGAEILEHTDDGLGFEDGELRLHVPITTAPGVEFHLGGHQVPLRVGEVWYLNVNLPHRVVNHSEEDRIHLVVDCQVDEWIHKLFETALSEASP